jgi:hypothetical protein
MNTVQDVIDLVRKELEDPLFNSVDTYSFYKDSEIIEWVNNAQQEFSAYTECLPDYDTYSISLTGGVRVYDYNTDIIKVQGGRLAASGNRVKPDSFVSIERRYILNNVGIIPYGGWEVVSGTPTHMVVNMEASKLFLYPTPTEDDTLNLYVYKLSNTVDSSDDALEIPTQHRYGLIFRVMSQAFNKLDTTNIQDSERSMLFSQKWESFKQDARKFYDQRFNRVVGK